MNIYEYKKKHYRRQKKLQNKIDELFNDMEYNPVVYLNYEKNKKAIEETNKLFEQRDSEHDLFLDSLLYGQCEMCCKFTSIRTGGVVTGGDIQWGYETIEIYCKNCKKGIKNVTI